MQNEKILKINLKHTLAEILSKTQRKNKVENCCKANMYFFIECNRKISHASKVLMSYVNTSAFTKNNNIFGAVE